jgi:endonuclease/exonuclease/phosphatase (EEP) superfamily protein YafD
MKLIIRVGQCLGFGVLALAGSLGAQTPGVFQTNLTLRIMAANLTSGGPTYQTAGLNILKGLKPDIVAIQEFNYGNNSAADFRHMLDTTFGTNFVYYRESGYSIPNGIISRFPIRAAGSWDDSLVPDRGFAWARLDVPGSNDLYVVSVHLYSSGSASDRNQEAQALKNLISANFPANAWVVVAGDFNTSVIIPSPLTPNQGAKWRPTSREITPTITSCPATPSPPISCPPSSPPACFPMGWCSIPPSIPL